MIPVKVAADDAQWRGVGFPLQRDCCPIKRPFGEM